MTYYAAETESGSCYLIELKNLPFRNPVWRLITKQGIFFIIGLMRFNENSVPAGKIASIEQFIGQQIYFDTDKKTELTITLKHTSIIHRVIKFK